MKATLTREDADWLEAVVAEWVPGPTVVTTELCYEHGHATNVVLSCWFGPTDEPRVQVFADYAANHDLEGVLERFRISKWPLRSHPAAAERPPEDTVTLEAALQAAERVFGSFTHLESI